METTHVSASEAANISGASQRRINQLAQDGTLESYRMGTSNAIKLASLKKWMANRPKRGRKNGNAKRKQ
jgi:excisionase family DNA binding protein